jgi:hypothetical protein
MSEGINTARSDLKGGAAWIGFGLLVVAESLRMDRFEKMGATVYTMPGFVPGMIGSLLALLGAILMLRGWTRQNQTQSEDDNTAAPVGQLINGRALLTLALTLLYAVVLIGHVSFWLATALFVAAFTWFFAPPEHTRLRQLVSALIAGLLTALVVTLVFEQIFLVRLP